MQPPGTSAPSGKVSVLNYAPDRSGPRFVRRSLVFYLTLFAGLWIVAIGATYLKLHAQGKPFRANAMIFEGGILRFSDFADFDPVTERFTLDGVKGQVYPAPMVCIYLAFTRNFTKPLHKYLLFVASGFLFVAVALAVALYRSRSNRILLATAALLTLLVGYPFIYLLERANAEGIIFLVHAAALTAFFARRYLVAGLLIALAASMKIFPGLLFALLLARKRYWELACSVAVILPLQIVSLWTLGPSISDAYASVKVGIENISRNYFLAYANNSIGYDHSLFALVKQFVHLRFRDEVLHAKILALGPWYSLFVAAGLLALYWFRIRKLPLLNQAMSLVVLAVTLPYLSFEYTLVSIFLVWAMFVLFLARDVTEGRERIPFLAALGVLGLMAFLFAPMNYITGGTQIYGGQVKALALLALTAFVLAFPMRSSLFGNPA